MNGPMGEGIQTSLSGKWPDAGTKLSLRCPFCHARLGQKKHRVLAAVLLSARDVCIRYSIAADSAFRPHALLLDDLCSGISPFPPAFW